MLPIYLNNNNQATFAIADEVVSCTTTQSSSSCSSCNNNSKWIQTNRCLDADFVPGPYDVICGRGQQTYNHAGNKYFRALVEKSAEHYSQAANRAERSLIVSKIIDIVRSQAEAGFVKQESSNGQWVEVGDLLAREKIGQMLRNALSGKYRSAMASKTKRRRNVQAKRVQMLHEVMHSCMEVESSTTKMEKASEAIVNKKGKKSKSDDELLALFTQQQSNMLSAISTDLVDQFLQAEVTAALVMDTPKNNDSDIDDSDSSSSFDSDDSEIVMV